MIQNGKYVVGLDNTLHGLKLAQKVGRRDNEFHRETLVIGCFKRQFRVFKGGLRWFRSIFPQK